MAPGSRCPFPGQGHASRGQWMMKSGVDGGLATIKWRAGQKRRGEQRRLGAPHVQAQRPAEKADAAVESQVLLLR